MTSLSFAKEDTIPEVVYFPGALTAQLSLVGGKGQSLIRMAQIGLPTPPGFVLTVAFFEPWLAELKLTKEWKAFCQADELDLESCSKALKERATKLELTREQSQKIDEALASLEGSKLFAVRSSSPEEDLEGFSFAGGYETLLGKRREEVGAAVKVAFASCLDYRVQCYKLAHGFNLLTPRIAVVVQEQIKSDISGVVFSINPLTNNYDEVVFNANWGLGESVVSGACTPDTVIVDKWKMQVKERAVGAKETRVMLLPEGGTREIVEGNGDGSLTAADLCLSDGTALSLTRYVKTLEEIFRKPVDIEWAVAGDREYILQARPITSFIPIPEEIQTAPGKPRKLYMDVSLTVQALEKPVSAMGCSVMKRVGRITGRKIWGIDPFDADGFGLARIAGGRFYLDLSKLLTLVSKETLASKIENIDPVVAKSIRTIDTSAYQNNLNPRVMAVPFTLVPIMLKCMPGAVRARTFPYDAHRDAQKALIQLKADLKKIASSNLGLSRLVDKLFDRTSKYLFKYSVPCFFGSRYALERMKSAARIIDPELLKNLEVALPHNVTTEMGLSLYRLSRLLENQHEKLDPTKPVSEQDLPDEFKRKWSEFIENYGHRGAGELDIASVRYREDSTTLLKQIKALAKEDDQERNPLKRFEDGVKLRTRTYEQICHQLKDIDRSKLNRFRNTYNAWEILGGYRELHKYCMIYMLDLLRKRLLTEAKRLVEKGQLESVEQIFDLTIEDLEKHGPWSKEDLSDRARANRVFTDKLKNVPRLPALIDSRGEILRPKLVAIEDGVAVGSPISAGVVRGRAKVLKAPDEKPLEVGEILVARATDPGWTPLFVNAAGLVLEVGGLLQHGALVAREYGLPCVGGLTGATNLFHDGDLLEVDGDNGIVRVIEES